MSSDLMIISLPCRSGVTANDDSVDYVDDIIHEDETINEILSILQEEEQERLQQELDALKDAERG